MSGTELIVNPAAGRGRGRELAASIAEKLNAGGLNVQPVFTRTPGETAALVASALRRGCECVAVAGGDGTFNEAVNGYIGTADPSQMLAIVPIGSGNDFAKMLGVDRDWRLACERILRRQSRRVDAGRCNGRYFANGIGAGFDAQVALFAQEVRWLRGNAIYASALARTLLLNHSTPQARIEYDGGALSGPITLVALANGVSYGGAFRMAPDADIADGLLELVVADSLTRLGILGFIPHVLRGTHVTRPGVRALRTRRAVIDTETPVVVHADGEIIERAATRLEVEVLPGVLRLVT